MSDSFKSAPLRRHNWQLQMSTLIEISGIVASQVLAALRLELFRTLLLQKVEFFDRHTTSELTSLLSVELNNVRSFVFGNVSRDRGLRAILEATGSVLVLCVLSWRLGPVLGLVIVATAVSAALYRQQTKHVEVQNSTALSHMMGVADQAFAAIRTVRYTNSQPLVSLCCCGQRTNGCT